MTDAFVRLGDAFVVNTVVAGHQSQSVVTAQYNGGVHIMWTDASASAGDVSGKSIKAQVFNSNMTRFRGEFLVNTSTFGDQHEASAVHLSNGFNIVAWTDNSGQGGDTSTSIKAQAFDSAGTKYKTEFLVNTVTQGEQSNPVVATLAAGRSVIAWTDHSNAAAPVVKAQVYDLGSVKSGGEIIVSGTGQLPDGLAISALSSGGFLVTWQDRSAPTAQLRAQVFSSAGAKVGSELAIGSVAPTADENGPNVVLLEGGRFLVSWTGVDEAGDLGVKAQLFDSAGARIGSEIAVNETLQGDQSSPAAASLKGGGFILAWTDAGGGASAIKAQVFNSAGARLGTEFAVSASLQAQSDASLATQTTGSTIITWTERNSAGDDDIKAQYFQLASSAPIEGTAGADTLTGTADPDFIYGLAGDDVLRGGAGGDLIDGGEGNDSLYGQEGNDILRGGAGNDYMEDLTVGHDLLEGGDGDDTLIVNRNNDPVHDRVTLNGGEGNDRLRYQGAGTDLYVDAGAGADTLELAVHDVKAFVTLGSGRDTILFDTPAPGVFRAPLIDVADFEAGLGGDVVDITRLVGDYPFHDGELQLVQAGSDAVLKFLTTQGFINLVTFRNRLTSEFLSDNFAGIRTPETRTIAGDGTVVTNSELLVGDPAVRITGNDVHFTNLAGGLLRAATAQGSALVLEGADATVENQAGATIKALDGTGTAILGSASSDSVRNLGVIEGHVRLGEGNDHYYGLVTDFNSKSHQATFELGGGDDSVEFDMGGKTLLNFANVTGGTGHDSLVIRNIEANTVVRLTIREFEEYRLFGAAGSSVNFRAKPEVADLYLSSGLKLIVPDNPGSTTAFTGPASGRVHLNGGSLEVGMNAAFAQVIGSDAAESVILSPRMFPPTSTPTAHGDISLAGGDDLFVWASYHASPGSVDGGAGDDRLRAGQDQPLQSFSAFSGFETIDHYLSNGFSGRTYNIAGLDGAVERLLLEADFRPSVLQLEGLQTPALSVGAGSTKLVLLAGSTVGRIDDRYLVDAQQAGAVNQDIDNRGIVTVGVNLGAGVDKFVNSGRVTGSVDLGAGDDTFVGKAGGSVDGNVRGGSGNDVYVIEAAGYVVVEAAGGGTDEVRTTLSNYALPAHVENLVYLGSGSGTLRGSAADNNLSGSSGNDVLNLADGGLDIASGGSGNDGFLFGAALTALDEIDGGDGKDVLAIQGNYSSLLLGAKSLVGVETLSILTHTDNRFGGGSSAPFSYNITAVEENVQAGSQLIVNASTLASGESLIFNGSAETNGSFFIYAGAGGDTLTGSGQADVFFFAEGRYNPGDAVQGGAGSDILVLRGNYSGGTAITFSAASIGGIETVTLMSHTDGRFFTGGTNFSYDFTTHDANVAAGQTLTVNGGKLLAAETMTFDGAAETDGHFRLFGGSGNDDLQGGGGNDLIYGGLGADSLTGNGGADTFRYQSVAESTLSSRDMINGFTPGADKIDLSRIDADNRTAADDAFTFIEAQAFHGIAGELRAYESDGSWIVEADVDGDGSADLVIGINAAQPISGSDFLL